MKNKMFTLKNGVSYYIIKKRYYSNSGWLEREITKEEYEKALKEFNEED